jgi:hypothetical protein
MDGEDEGNCGWSLVKRVSVRIQVMLHKCCTYISMLFCMIDAGVAPMARSAEKEGRLHSVRSGRGGCARQCP